MLYLIHVLECRVGSVSSFGVVVVVWSEVCILAKVCQVLLAFSSLADAQASIQASIDDHLPVARLKGGYGCHRTALALKRAYSLQDCRLELLLPGLLFLELLWALSETPNVHDTIL